MNASLFWAVVWAIVFVLAVVGIFWNSAQVITAIIAAAMTAAFVRDYIKTRPFKK